MNQDFQLPNNNLDDDDDSDSVPELIESEPTIPYDLFDFGNEFDQDYYSYHFRDTDGNVEKPTGIYCSKCNCACIIDFIHLKCGHNYHDGCILLKNKNFFTRCIICKNLLSQ
jgi:hypothetical protein